MARCFDSHAADPVLARMSIDFNALANFAVFRYVQSTPIFLGFDVRIERPRNWAGKQIDDIVLTRHD